MPPSDEHLCARSFEDLGPAAALARSLVSYLVAVAERDERIEGVLVGGSAARRELDALSDLDLVLACTAAALESVREELPRFAARAGPLLSCFYGVHVGEPGLLICLYGPPLLHVDLSCLARAELHEHFERLECVWDRDGSVAEALRRGSVRPPGAHHQWIEDRFWVWIHYGTTKTARGEYLECIEVLALMRKLALGPLIAAESRRPAAGMRRVELYSPARARALGATVGTPDRGGCVAALRAAAQLYRELRVNTGSQASERRSEAEDAVMRQLEELAGEG